MPSGRFFSILRRQASYSAQPGFLVALVCSWFGFAMGSQWIRSSVTHAHSPSTSTTSNVQVKVSKATASTLLNFRKRRDVRT